jgi:hypothetical protein
MLFDRADGIYHQLTSYLPFFSIPVLLAFVLAGKGRYRPAWFIALSVPGLAIPFFGLGELLSDEPRPYLSNRAILLLWYSTINPSIWVFPAVCVFQLAKIVKSDWAVMSRSSFFLCALLVGLYFWNDLLIGIARYG